MDPTPRWIRDLTRLLPIRSQVVLSGNIRDSFPTPLAGGTTLAPLLRCLWTHLAALDYKFLLVYDPVEGLRPYPNEPAVVELATRLFDLKLADPARHLEVVGAPIEGILANFERAASSGLPLWIRTPVIPGSTDSEENLRAIARLIRKIAPGAARWDLLAFSNLCGAKYEMLGLRFPLQGIPLFTPDELERRLAWVLAEGAGMARLSGPTRRGGT